jgi:hypothetical protein
MVPSSAFVPIIGGKRSSGDGFPLGKTICFGSLEFVTDRFSSLSLSPLGGGSGAIIMGLARGGPPLLLRTLTGCPIEGFPVAHGGEGRTELLSPGRHGVESPPISTTTIPQPENPLTNQATTTIPPWQEMPWPDDNLPLERWRACREAAQRRIKPVGGQAVMEAGPSEPLQHEPPTKERILMMDYTASQARSLGPLLPPRNQWGIDEVDRLYRQLTEIHAIGAA